MMIVLNYLMLGGGERFITTTNTTTSTTREYYFLLPENSLLSDAFLLTIDRITKLRSLDDELLSTDLPIIVVGTVVADADDFVVDALMMGTSGILWLDEDASDATLDGKDWLLGIAGRCCGSACMVEEISRRRYRHLISLPLAATGGGLQRGARFLLIGRKAEILDSLRNMVSV